MTKVLMIVESPNKAKKIRGFFPGFTLVATVGHFKDLPADSMGVEPPDHKPDYVVSKGKQAIVTKLRAAAKAADIIYVATDPDREGEAIAAHVVNTLGKVHEKKIARITYTEVNKKAIERAIEMKRTVDWPLVKAQEARRVLDRYVGYLVSPELTKKLKSRGAAGRVQSPAVRLIVDRQREIQTFKPITHYGVTASMINAGIEFEAVWKPGIPQHTLITDIQQAETVMSRTHTLTVHQVDKVPRIVAPPKPLITSSYVRLMGGALKMTTKTAMDAAQKLFEAGLITYHRTDSPTMSDEFVATVRAFAHNNKLPVPPTVRELRGSANAQQGHECLRVTDIELVKADGLDDPQLRAVYGLVWLVTLQSQLADGEDALTTIQFRNATDDVFVSKARQVMQAGWRLAARQFQQPDAGTADEQEDDRVSPSTLPALVVNQLLTPTSVTLRTKVTEPPSPYTEKSLVEKLEKLGIGRPSTYASTIERIVQMGYVARHKKSLQLTATEQGIAVIDELAGHFVFMEYSYTAQIESAFDAIAQRKADYLGVVHTAWEALQQELKHFSGGASNVAPVPAVPLAPTQQPKQPARVIEPKAIPGSRCPSCASGVLSINKLKSGSNAGRAFMGCTHFPVCRFFQWVH
jgi:DNA topoisomerase-1